MSESADGLGLELSQVERRVPETTKRCIKERQVQMSKPMISSSSSSIVEAFILYFVIPTILLLLVSKYVELPSGLFPQNIKTNGSSEEATPYLTHPTPETQSTQSIQLNKKNKINKKKNEIAVDRSGTSNKNINAKETQPVHSAPHTLSGIDTQIDAARQVLRVSALTNPSLIGPIISSSHFAHNLIFPCLRTNPTTL